MASLFGAFGMTYAFTASEFDLTGAGFVTSVQAAAFTASVGVTAGNASFATYTDGGVFAFLCISLGTCIPRSYTLGLDVSAGDTAAGIALVRSTNVSTVPLPAAFPFLLTGLAGFAALRRSKRGTRE